MGRKGQRRLLGRFKVWWNLVGWVPGQERWLLPWAAFLAPLGGLHRTEGMGYHAHPPHCSWKDIQRTVTFGRGGRPLGEQEPNERHRVCSLMKTTPCAYVRACVCVLMAHRPFTDLVDLCFCLFY